MTEEGILEGKSQGMKELKLLWDEKERPVKMLSRPLDKDPKYLASKLRNCPLWRSSMIGLAKHQHRPAPNPHRLCIRTPRR